MRIGILETGRPAPALARQHGSYADMVERLLATEGDFSFTRSWLQGGVFPPSAEACDGWVVTGSRSSVTEEASWMLRLEALLRQAQERGRKVVGICFGHQILAKALGGRVAPAPNGWQLGLKDYRLLAKPDWLADLPDRLRLNAIHQDQVLAAPEGAALLATALGCPLAALGYGDWAVSFQAHPEFSLPFEKALLDAYTGDGLPEELGREALARLAEADAATDGPRLGRALTRFLSGSTRSF
jgi:GMP synthase (glutamine-hydrolysing)